MPEPVLVDLPLHCAYCGRPVIVTYLKPDAPPDPHAINTWVCPYRGCGLANAVAGLPVVSAIPRETRRRA